MPLFVTTIRFQGRARIAITAPDIPGIDLALNQLTPHELTQPQVLRQIRYQAPEILKVDFLETITSDDVDLPLSGSSLDALHPWPETVPKTVKGYFEILSDPNIPPGSALYQSRAEELGQQILFPELEPVN